MSGRACVVAAAIAAGTGARADVTILEPVADAFVAASRPESNFGGAGGLTVAADGMANGEFQGLMRFDAFGARAIFDAALGAGRWRVASVTLQVAFGTPSNPLFNPVQAGPIGVSWLGGDAWEEGSGSPMMPTSDGVRFDDLAVLIAAGDEPLGEFQFDGSISGTAVWTLTASPGLNADILSGSMLSLRVHGTGAPVSCLFRSRNYPVAENHPVLTITAEPACYANCDGSTTAPVLNILDFGCFLNRFAAGDTYANCDGSTVQPVLNVLDFGCFLNTFAAGCP